MCLDLIFKELLSLDRDLLLSVNNAYNPFLDGFMWWVTGKFSWIPFYLLLVAVIIFNYQRKALPLILLVIVLIGMSDFLASGIIKPLVLRFRPSHEPELAGMVHIVNNYRGGKYGFVSSHACNVFALAFYFYFTLNEKLPWLKYILFIWAFLVSFSRIYLGVHYPADIIVPFFLSIPIAYVVSRIYVKIEQKFYKSEI